MISPTMHRSHEHTNELQPGHPLPVVAYEGVLGERMIRALEGAGLLFSIAFSSADHGARIMATAAGMGIMGMPARMCGIL
jgi:hypothetical protein